MIIFDDDVLTSVNPHNSHFHRHDANRVTPISVGQWMSCLKLGFKLQWTLRHARRCNAIRRGGGESCDGELVGTISKFIGLVWWHGTVSYTHLRAHETG